MSSKMQPDRPVRLPDRPPPPTQPAATSPRTGNLPASLPDVWADARGYQRLAYLPTTKEKERTGTMRIGLTSIYVDDQDKAEQFYTQILGFQVHTSAPYSDTERWLTVVTPQEPDGVQLVLHLADEPARAFQAASRQQGRPMLSLATDDCQGEAERLTAKGVVFVKEPWRRDYGGIDAVFDDTCGNLINLHQD